MKINKAGFIIPSTAAEWAPIRRLGLSADHNQALRDFRGNALSRMIRLHRDNTPWSHNDYQKLSDAVAVLNARHNR